jgi:hypothetical protein
MARRLDPRQPVTERSALCLRSGRMALRSAASRNLLKPRPRLARWSGSRRRRRKAEPSGGIVYEPRRYPQCPECCGNPRLLCRGTRSSNPSPSSRESTNFRFLAFGIDSVRALRCPNGNRKFESTPLLRRVNKLSVPLKMTLVDGASDGAAHIGGHYA